MEPFQLSDTLRREIIECFDEHCEMWHVELPKRSQVRLEQWSFMWGDHIVEAVALFGYQTSLGAHGLLKTEFRFIQDGTFPQTIADHIIIGVPIRPDTEGRELLAKVAREFMVWVREHPEALSRLDIVRGHEFRDDDLIVLVREYAHQPVPQRSPMRILE